MEKIRENARVAAVFGADSGSVPVKALAVQIEAFCVCGLSWSGCAPWLPGELIRVRVLAVRTASERVAMS